MNSGNLAQTRLAHQHEPRYRGVDALDEAREVDARGSSSRAEEGENDQDDGYAGKTLGIHGFYFREQDLGGTGLRNEDVKYSI